MNTIYYKDHDWLESGVKQDRILKNMQGAMVVAVIDDIVEAIFHLDLEFAEELISAISFTECNIDPHSDIFCVQMNLINNIQKTVLCPEFVYAALLSDPKLVIVKTHHKYHEFVSEGWSYINEEFIIPGEME